MKFQTRNVIENMKSNKWNYSKKTKFLFQHETNLFLLNFLIFKSNNFPFFLIMKYWRCSFFRTISYFLGIILCHYFSVIYEGNFLIFISFSILLYISYQFFICLIIIYVWFIYLTRDFPLVISWFMTGIFDGKRFEVRGQLL